MKKFLIIAALAAVAVAAYRKYAQNQEELDLWAEVTDPIA
ncbi:MAG: DLW-39 family protein [Bifidobacteriaceae bacterium]|nr:DLW-39 family protein [Bifidobacteriaceae bacterium]